MTMDLAMTVLTGGVCGLAGGVLSSLSAWLLVDEWRWRRVRRRLDNVAQATLGLCGGLLFVVLATMAWAAVFVQ